jgi:hypothetical protein
VKTSNEDNNASPARKKTGIPKGMCQTKKRTSDKYFWLYGWIYRTPIECRYDDYDMASQFLQMCERGFVTVCWFKIRKRRAVLDGLEFSLEAAVGRIGTGAVHRLGSAIANLASTKPELLTGDSVVVFEIRRGLTRPRCIGCPAICFNWEQDN